MSLCSASAQAPLQEGRDGAPPTADDHASNVRVMRMDALLVGGLWHFDLVPWNTFNRTLAYVMGLGDLQEDGLPQVVLPRDPLDSLATDVCEGEPRAVLAARAHILLKMIQVDPASKGVFICRLCNFASVLMWLVLMCMDRLLREKVQYAAPAPRAAPADHAAAAAGDDGGRGAACPAVPRPASRRRFPRCIWRPRSARSTST